MQYELAKRDVLVDLAISRYFAAVDRKDIEGALACFHDEALFTVQTSFTRHAGKPAIRRMFEDFLGGYATILHHDFVTTVDAANGRIAASFEAVLTEADGAVTRLNNANFWRVREGRFQEVYVYMSGANVLI